MEDRGEDNTQLGKITLAVSLGVGLIYLAFLKPGIWGVDGNDMLQVSQSLVTEFDFSVPPGGEGVLGPDGKYYSIRYPLLPILAMPFVAVGLALAHLLHLPEQYAAAVCALVLSIILTSVTASLIVLLALRLGSSKEGAYFAAISYAFGSTALVYSREFFAEPLLSLLTTLSLYWVLGKSVREHAGASILAGLAVTAKPAGVVVGPILSAYLLVKKYPLRTVIGPSLGTFMGALLYMFYNFMRFGSISSSGQNSSRFELAGMPERLIGLILSPGAGGGLFWYCPPTILAIFGFRKLFKSKPLEALALLGIFSSYWVLHSFWRFGGWNWGPRFLVPTLPLLFAVIALLDKKWWQWLLGLTILGFFVNAPSLISFYQRYYAEAADARRLGKALTLWGNPSDAPLFNAWGAAFRQLNDALSNNVADVLKQVGAPPEKGQLASAQLLKIVAVWWWVLPAANIPIWLGFVVACFLLTMGIIMLRRAWFYL